MNVNRSVEGDWSTQGVEMYACGATQVEWAGSSSGGVGLFFWVGSCETDALNERKLSSKPLQA